MNMRSTIMELSLASGGAAVPCIGNLSISVPPPSPMPQGGTLMDKQGTRHPLVGQ